MRITILILIAFFSLYPYIYAQDIGSKGISINRKPPDKETGKTYALIIGISKYRNPGIPQLQYADRDAVAFRDYLLASGVDSNDIILRTNENARYAEIMFDLDDICSNKAKTGDKVFIYFSGHGDVESHVVTNDGYLLPYDAPKNVYCISAINVKILETYVATLSSKGAQVVVITDACHSGNLAGGLEGLKNIQTVLGSKWQDEIKILSCQPGELSLEGKQWGGGRGLFSYELINGMAGMADRNKDGKVTLGELNRYLSDKVADGASPIAQNPILYGDMSAEVSKVNQPLLSSLSSPFSQNIFASIDLKGFEDALLNGLEDNIKGNYYSFVQCLNSYDFTGAWLRKSKIQKSPYDFYLKIPDNDSTKVLKAYMKRNYASAIIRDLDALIEMYVNNSFDDPSEDDIERIKDEATLLREIMGDEKLKKLGMFTKTLFWDAYLMHYDVMEEADAYAAINKLNLLIAYANNEAFTLNLRGVFLQKVKRYQEAMVDFKRASLISPNLGINLRYLGENYCYTMNYDSALIIFRKLKAIPKWQWMADARLGMTYHYLNQPDSMDFYFEKMCEDENKESDTFCIARSYRLISMFFAEDFNDYPMAIEFCKKAAAIHCIGDEYVEIARYYTLSCDTENAHKTLQDLFERLPNIEETDAYNLSCAYSLLNEKTSAIKYLEEAIEHEQAGFNFEWTMKDTDLDNIRSTPEFKALMRKYFPDQYKE